MGSKKKTISNVGYTKLLPQDKNLFIEAINKAVGQSHTIDSAFLGSSLMEVNKSHRYKAFQRLDGATEVNAALINLDMKAAYAAYGFSCSRDKPIAVNSGNSAEYQFYSGLGKSTTECNGYKVFGNYAYKDFSIDAVTGSVSAMRMIVDTSKIPCEVTDDIIITRPGMADNIIMLTVENQTSFGTRTSVWFPESQFSSETILDGMTFLTVSYKSNFVKNTSRYIKAMNAQLGIPQKTPKKDGDGNEEPFEDAINNNEYRDIFLSYAVPYEGDYTTIIDRIYGGMDIKFSFKHTTVSIDGDSNNSWQPKFGPADNYCKGVFGSGSISKVMRINGKTLTLDSGQKQQYIIPIEWMQKKRTLPQKYKDLGESMTMFIYAQKTVKVKWHQTGFFKFLGFIVGIVFVVMGNPMVLVAMMASYAIGAILGSKAAAIFGIIMTVVTFGQSLANAAMTMVDMVVKIVDIAAQAFKIYFERSMKSIQASIDDKIEKVKEAKEELDDILNTPVNIGFLSDKMDEFYELAYESVYNSYSMAYNYDNMYQGQKYE